MPDILKIQSASHSRMPASSAFATTREGRYEPNARRNAMSGSVDAQIVRYTRHRIELPRCQVRIRHLELEFLLQLSDHVGQGKRVEHAGLKQGLFRVRRQRLLRHFFDN